MSAVGNVHPGVINKAGGRCGSQKAGMERMVVPGVDRVDEANGCM